MSMHHVCVNGPAFTHLRSAAAHRLVAAEARRQHTQYVNMADLQMQAWLAIERWEASPVFGSRLHMSVDSTMRLAVDVKASIVRAEAEVAGRRELAKQVVTEALPHIGAPYATWRHASMLSAYFRESLDTYVPAWRASLVELGEEFATCIRDEDDESFVSVLNGMNANSLGLRSTSVRELRSNLVQRYYEKTGNNVWCCDHCDDWKTEDDGSSTVETGEGDEQWCDGCAESARWSEAMSTYIPEDDAVPYYTDYSDFESECSNDWVTHRWARRQDDVHGISHPDSGGTCFLDDSTYDEYREEYEEAGLYSYHSGVRVGFIATEYKKRQHKVYCGVEVELEFDSSRDKNRCARKLIKEQREYGVCEKDGSLNEGFEFITGYTGLDVHRKRLPQIMLEAQYNNAIDDASSAGLHVHVSEAGMSAWHKHKLARWIYASSNRSFIERIAGREIGGEYCTDQDFTEHAIRAGRAHREAKSWPKEYNTSMSEVRDYVNQPFKDSDRYGALSYATSTGRTVEFRLFRGTTDAERALACIEFAFLSWHFAMQTPPRDLTPEHFGRFVCRPDNRADSVYFRKVFGRILVIEQADEPYRAKPRRRETVGA